MGKPDPTDTDKFLGKTDFPKLIQQISEEISNLKNQLAPIDERKASLVDERNQKQQELDTAKSESSENLELTQELSNSIRDLNTQIDRIESEADPLRIQLNARMQELAHAKTNPPTHPGEGWVFEGIHSTGSALTNRFAELERDPRYGRGNVRMCNTAYNIGRKDVVIKGNGTIFVKPK